MIYPTPEQLSGEGKYNRYTLVIASAKCARAITDEYVEQRAEAEKLIANKEPLARIRVSIVNHIKALIMAKEAGNAGVLVERTGMNDYRAKKLVMQSHNFSMKDLISLYLTASDSDSEFKHGLIDERYSLEIILVHRLLRPM